MRFLRRVLATVLIIFAVLLFIDSASHFLGEEGGLTLTADSLQFVGLEQIGKWVGANLITGGVLFVAALVLLLVAAIFDADTVVGAINGIGRLVGGLIALPGRIVEGIVSSGGAGGVIILALAAFGVYILTRDKK